MRSWVSALIALAACGTPAPPPAPVRAPAPRCAAITGTCDASIPDDAVFGLVKRRCWACHAENGLAGHDFTSIAALRSAPVVEMVGSCQMPPDGSPLPDPDRRRLVDWASCQGAHSPL